MIILRQEWIRYGAARGKPTVVVVRRLVALRRRKCSLDGRLSWKVALVEALLIWGQHLLRGDLLFAR